MRKPISQAFNVAINHIAGKLFPCGFDVAESAPLTLRSLTKHVKETWRMLVWNGASSQTMFACEETNFAFRAWHDWCHVSGGFEFNAEGEAKACAMQQSHVRKLYGFTKEADFFCKLLDIEVNGQLAYHATHDRFPEDQYAFTLTMLESA